MSVLYKLWSDCGEGFLLLGWHELLKFGNPVRSAAAAAAQYGCALLGLQVN